MLTSAARIYRAFEVDHRSDSGASMPARIPRVWTTALLLVFLCSFLTTLQAQAPLAQGVEVIGMTVSDIERSLHFYTEVLPFKKVSETEVSGPDYEHAEGVFGLRMRVVRLRLGNEFIELAEYLAPRGRPIPVDSVSNDLWFQHIAIIVRDMDAAYKILRQNNVQHASSGPQLLPSWNQNVAGIRAFYFKDPDGHNLEILQFPADKGAAKWHTATDQLFLGIDHTAIAVAATDPSLKFYRDLLGMRVAGESENYGTEQEHLNNVFGARLRITTLRSASGPGIELLEYLSPRGGASVPSGRACQRHRPLADPTAHCEHRGRLKIHARRSRAIRFTWLRRYPGSAAWFS